MPFETVVSDPESERLARIASDWIARAVAASGMADVVAPRAASPWTEAGEDDGGTDTNDETPYYAYPATGHVVTGDMRRWKVSE